MPKNAQTTTQLHSSYMLAKSYSKFSSQASTVCEPRTSRCSSRISKRQRNQRSNCQHSLDHQRSKRVPEKHLFLLYWLCKSLWLDHNILWKILKEMGIPHHLTCLLRNLYTDQETTVRIGHGMTYLFQIVKGVCQGCILLSCLFNLYAEYIMKILGWMKHKLEWRLPGEISITSDMQMIPSLRQKAKN